MAPVPLPGTATSIETFCTTPSVHNIDQLMDYTTEDGSNLYKLASMPLKTKFDLPAANTLVFIDQLRDRAQVVGWDAGSYQITSTKYNVATAGNPPHLKDLFTQYGQILVDTICTKVITWKPGEVKANSRSTQNNMEFYKCLMDFLPDEACLRILPHQHEYEDQDGNYHDPLFTPSCALQPLAAKLPLLCSEITYTILWYSSIATSSNSTSTSAQTRTSSLGTKRQLMARFI